MDRRLWRHHHKIKNLAHLPTLRHFLSVYQPPYIGTAAAFPAFLAGFPFRRLILLYIDCVCSSVHFCPSFRTNTHSFEVSSSSLAMNLDPVKRGWISASIAFSLSCGGGRAMGMNKYQIDGKGMPEIDRTNISVCSEQRILSITYRTREVITRLSEVVA